MKLLESLMGANWRTSLSGGLTVVCTAIALKPELVSFVPEPARGYIIGIAGIVAVAAGSTFAHLAKDKAVSGNGAEGDPQRVADSTTGRNRVLSLALPLALCLLFTGCHALDNYDRSYSLEVSDGKRTISTGVTLTPRATPKPRLSPTLGLTPLYHEGRIIYPPADLSARLVVTGEVLP